MLTRDEIQNIVDRVKFQTRWFLLTEKGDGYLLQMAYYEPDVEHPGEPVLQKTRKWYVSPHMTESEIVETCWAMVCRSQIHVASEHFEYDGRRVYSQHFAVRARIDMCDNGAYDVRTPLMVGLPDGRHESIAREQDGGEGVGGGRDALGG